jgi:hypothetical protein
MTRQLTEQMLADAGVPQAACWKLPAANPYARP